MTSPADDYSARGDASGCGAPFDAMWTCTRPSGHEGLHAAHGRSERLMAVQGQTSGSNPLVYMRS